MAGQAVFSRRTAEPQEMAEVEFAVFNQLSKDNFSRWIVPLVDHLDKLRPGISGSVLDVACGPGFLTKELSLRYKGSSVVGLDNSSVALRLARENCSGLRNVKFVKGSVYDLPFKDDQFEVVVCKDSLHHFDRSKQAIKEMLRVTQPGGIVYIQDLRRDLPRYLFDRASPPDTELKKLQFYSIRASWTKNELTSQLEKMGVKNFTLRTRKSTEKDKRFYQSRLGVEPQLLKEGFQARYYLVIKK